MPKIKTFLTLAGILFLTAGILAGGTLIRTKQNITERAAAATNLVIAPSTQSAAGGSDIAFFVKMNTGANHVIGLDLILKFNPTILQVGSLQRGGDVSALNSTIANTFDNSAGTISYAIFTIDKTQAVSGGVVEVLKVNAKIKNTAPTGSYLLTFDPTTAVSATSETQNALTSVTSGTLIVTSSTPIPTSTPTASPTPAPGQPNSCGGTCGSNSNCGVNLFCSQGFCRNPNCSWSTDCSCSSPTTTPTATPTKTSAGTAKPSVSPSPVTVNSTPLPSASAGNFWQNVFNNASPETSPAPSPTLTPLSLPFASNGNFLPWIIGALIVAGITLILIVLGIYKETGSHQTKPPVIKM